MYFTKTTSKFTQAGLKLEFGFPKNFPGVSTYFSPLQRNHQFVYTLINLLSHIRKVSAGAPNDLSYVK